jgi:8-oxo-dGTP diphosphatase
MIYVKPVRKAVRTFLLEEDKVLAIKYITNDDKQDFYDIPGGKIEDVETGEQTAIREFKEEAGIEIFNPKYTGNLIVEYPDRIFDFDVFITSEYKGMPQITEENASEWIKINDLLQKEKKFAEIYLLDNNHKTDLLNMNNFKFHFITDKNHYMIDEVFYQNLDEFWKEYLQS